jgi:hypothetical protein
VHMYDIADLPSVACIHLAVACDWCDAAALSSVDGRCAKQVGPPADVADDRSNALEGPELPKSFRDDKELVQVRE